MVALGVAIFLELAGGVLFVLGSNLGSCFLVGSPPISKPRVKPPAVETPSLKTPMTGSPVRHQRCGSISPTVTASRHNPSCVQENDDYGASLCAQATFLLLVTPIMHNFWTLKEGSQEQLVDMCDHQPAAHAILHRLMAQDDHHVYTSQSIVHDDSIS